MQRADYVTTQVSLFFPYCTLISLRYMYFDFDLVFKVFYLQHCEPSAQAISQ